MRLHRGIWVGACLLLAAAGCGKDDKKINDVGVYSPILTGISSNHEPAARGAANLLTAQVTNVNGLTLKYHWSVEAGTLAESTTAAVTWTPPDTIAAYHVTVSIEADDGDKHFFKTVTILMSVDNEFTRWTNSDQIQFDPAPAPNGGVLYAEYHNVATGSSDAYRIDSPLAPPIQLTSGFFSVTSPTPRSDQGNIAFTAKLSSSAVAPSIYILPYPGGDASAAQVAEARSQYQTRVAGPRYARVGTRYAFSSDSIGKDAFDNVLSGGKWTINWHNGANIYGEPPFGVLEPVYFFSDDNGLQPDLETYMMNPSWGPDTDADGDPDSIMALGLDFPGTFAEATHGLYVFAAPDTGHVTSYKLWLAGASDIRDIDWSPDGQYVVFTRKNAGTNDRDIWIINRSAANLSDAVRVTYGPADDSQPRFSADGNSIFFVSNRVNRYGMTGIYGTQRRGTNIWSVSQFDRP